MLSKKQPVEHFHSNSVVSGSSLIRLLKVLLRSPSHLAGWLVASLIFGSQPWWWQWFEQSPELTLSYSAGQWSFISLGLTLCLLTAGLYYLRKRTIRSLSMKHQLHMISHEVRDRYCELQSNKDTRLSVGGISIQFCDLIRNYFAILTGKSASLGVAIRIAEEQNGLPVFCTAGRTNLNKNRSRESEPLKYDEGIAKLMMNKSGVWIYNDLVQARADGTYTTQKNDELFGDEIKTMMVAPINGWDGTKTALLGMLYITSSETGVFDEKNVDSIGFLADNLAVLYSAMLVSSTALTKIQTGN